MAEVPPGFWTVLAFVAGSAVGSFLNVVIYRLPRGESLVSPGSRCPQCGHALRAFENVPIVSFLALRARCSQCRQPISWRYPLVEAATGALFAVIVAHFGAGWQALVYCLFTAALVAALFIDLELYIIPDELTAFALALAVVYDVTMVAGGDAAHALWWGWLPRSIGGAVVCAAAFVAIQLIGLALFRKDSMGDGDVKLGRAIGAMLPLGAAFVSFALAIALGAVVGTAIVVQRLLTGRARADADAGGMEAEPEPDATPFREVLACGAAYVFFVDLIAMVAAKAGAGWARRMLQSDGEAPLEVDDGFRPGLTHVPFGPYMVVGALLAMFVGSDLLDWYLNWAFPAPPGL